MRPFFLKKKIKAIHWQHFAELAKKKTHQLIFQLLLTFYFAMSLLILNQLWTVLCWHQHFPFTFTQRCSGGTTKRTNRLHCLTAVKRAVLNLFMASLVKHPPVDLPLCRLKVFMRLWMITLHFVSSCPKCYLK